MQANQLKQLIKDSALAHGFHRVNIASLAPMYEARQEYERWLSQGFAAGMEYLKRNPELRTTPALLYPGARSAIILAISYYTTVPEPSLFPYAGKVARYAVGLDYHEVIRARLFDLKSDLEKSLGRPLQAKGFTDDVPLYEQSFAARHGVGFAGKNTLIIGPKLDGSYYFLAELFTDLEIDPDGPYIGTCGNCFRCGSACPTKAITDDGQVDANLCISYLTIENKGGISSELRPKIGEWVFGCDICQEVCPYNQRPPQAIWPEFQSDKGAGHYLDLVSVLAIRDAQEFRSRFGHTPLSRAKRRGLLRNAAVVAGNHLSKIAARDSIDSMSWQWTQAVTEQLIAIVREDPDPMLREHCFWSLSRSPAVSKNELFAFLAGVNDVFLADQMRLNLE